MITKIYIINRRSWRLLCAALLFILQSSLFTSCTDYLDKAPLSDINDTDPYKNFKNFQGFTEGLYNCIPVETAQTWHCCWNFGEDEYWEPNETRLLTYSIDQGDYWAWSNCEYGFFKAACPDPEGTDRFNKGYMYGLAWYGIRKANIGIENLDKLADATQEEKNLIAGQLYFFRGWFHFMLMQYWGGLPYIDRVLPAGEVFRLPRLSYHETAEKAAADFQKAADLLPVDWDQTAAGKSTLGKNFIRANKIMALAYLGKNLLWAGSPLMNQVSTGSATYNAELCKRAADALGQALALSEQTGRYELASIDEYNDIFYTWKQNKIPGLKEVIFWENMTVGDYGAFRWNLVNDWRPMCINGSGIKCYPTANYVDYFGMANGLPIVDATKKDAESGYDPEYPFRNRDPRFYKDIVFDAMKCVKDGSKVQNDPNKQYASLYAGGYYRTANPAKAMSVIAVIRIFQRFLIFIP